MRPAALALLLLLAPSLAAHPELADCGTGVEAGDGYNDATPLAWPVTCSAQLNDTWDSTDYYRVDCGGLVRVPFAELVVTLTSESAFLNLRAFPPVPVAPFVHPPALDADFTGADGTAVVRFECPVRGEYRLQVMNGGLEQDFLDIAYALDVRAG